MKHDRCVMMGTLLLITVLGFWTTWPTGSFAADQSGLARIAVVDLDSQGEKAKSQQLGKTAAQVLTTAFVKQGRFDVVERQALERVIKEQEMGATGLIDLDTATPFSLERACHPPKRTNIYP